MSDQILSSRNSLASLVSVTTAKPESKLVSKTQKLAFAANKISATLAALETKLDLLEEPTGKENSRFKKSVKKSENVKVTKRTIVSPVPHVEEGAYFQVDPANEEQLHEMAHYLQSRGIYPASSIPIYKQQEQGRSASPTVIISDPKTDSIQKAVDELPDKFISKLKSIQNDKDNSDHARVYSLEAQLTQAKESLAVSKESNQVKNEQLKRDNHELAMKVSRQQLEMNSLLQQNNLLRTENRRGVESLSGSKPIDYRVNVALKERILMLVDEGHQLISHLGPSNSTTTLQLVRSHINQLSNPISPTAFDSILECIVRLLVDSLSIIRETAQFDSRMEIILKESEMLRQEASGGISKIRNDLESKLFHALKEKESLDHMLHSAQFELKNITNDNHELIREVDALRRDNGQLNDLVSQPITPRLMMVSDPNDTTHLTAQISELNIRNTHLISKTDMLEKHISDLRHDSGSSKSKLVYYESKSLDLESRLLRSKKKLSQYKVVIQEERAKGEKAIVLITSLKEQLAAASVPKDMDPLKHLDSVIQKELDNARSKIENETETKSPHAQINMEQQNEISRLQLQQFQSVVQEHIATTNQLNENNEALVEQLQKSKNKLKIREQAWMEKIQDARRDYEVLLSDYTTLERLMDAYDSQFKSVSQWNNESVSGAVLAHPFPFADILIRITKRSTDLQATAASLEEHMTGLKATVESQEEKITEMKEASIVMATEKIQSDEHVKKYEQTNYKLQDRIRNIELELVHTTQAKSKSDLKLKKIVSAYQQMMQ